MNLNMTCSALGLLKAPKSYRNQSVLQSNLLPLHAKVTGDFAGQSVQDEMVWWVGCTKNSDSWEYISGI